MQTFTGIGMFGLMHTQRHTVILGNCVVRPLYAAAADNQQ